MYSESMAQFRKEPLSNKHYYHIYSRSIAKFVVFNNQDEYERLYQLVSLCRHTNFNYSYSQFMKRSKGWRNEVINEMLQQDDLIVEIVLYCIMPTHIHLILRQVKDGGVTKFMARVLNGYSKYFNKQHKRTGPLWSGRFKSVLITHNEQLLHLTRYIHLNPTSANLVNKPIDWPNSSYREYVDVDSKRGRGICKYDNIITMSRKEYKKFVEDHKNYQRDRSIIKYLTIDDYSG